VPDVRDWSAPEHVQPAADTRAADARACAYPASGTDARTYAAADGTTDAASGADARADTAC
jgi:hypothetical protein